MNRVIKSCPRVARPTGDAVRARSARAKAPFWSNNLPALFVAAILATTSVACVERTIIEQEETSESDQTQGSEMVGFDQNGEQTPSVSAPAKTLGEKGCPACGPLPDPWTAGPLPDPWQAQKPGSGIDPTTMKTKSSSSSGSSHKD